MEALKTTFESLNGVRDSLGRRLIDSQGLLASEGKYYSSTLTELAMQAAILARANENAALELQIQSEMSLNGKA